MSQWGGMDDILGRSLAPWRSIAAQLLISVSQQRQTDLRMLTLDSRRSAMHTCGRDCGDLFGEGNRGQFHSSRTLHLGRALKRLDML